jgi:hypothetical protein
MSRTLKKLLIEIQLLCIDISLKPNGKYFGFLNYAGNVNSIDVFYKEKATGEFTWICITKSITLQNLKQIKSKLKKLLEE